MSHMHSEDCLYASPEDVLRVCRTERTVIRHFLRHSPDRFLYRKRDTHNRQSGIITNVLRILVGLLTALLAILAITILVVTMTAPVFDESTATQNTMLLKKNATAKGGVCI